MTNPAYHGLDPDQVQAFLAGADQRALEPPRFDSREDLVDRVLGLARDAAAGQEQPLTYLAGTVPGFRETLVAALSGGLRSLEAWRLGHDRYQPSVDAPLRAADKALAASDYDRAHAELKAALVAASATQGEPPHPLPELEDVLRELRDTLVQILPPTREQQVAELSHYLAGTLYELGETTIPTAEETEGKAEVWVSSGGPGRYAVAPNLEADPATYDVYYDNVNDPPPGRASTSAPSPTGTRWSRRSGPTRAPVQGTRSRASRRRRRSRTTSTMTASSAGTPATSPSGWTRRA